MTGLTHADILRNVVKAGVPHAYHNVPFSSFDPYGTALRDYLQSDSFENGTGGLLLCGPYPDRVKVLPVMARGMAAMMCNVRLVNLRELVTYLGDRTSERLSVYQDVDILCLGWFQTSMSRDECPYTYAERSLVEQFLSDRIEACGKRNFLSALPTLSLLNWWSTDFVNLLRTHVQPFEMGIVNAR